MPVKCEGDGEGWHPPECDGKASFLAMQEDCPPGCSHALSVACWSYAMEHMTPDIVWTAVPLVVVVDLT